MRRFYKTTFWIVQQSPPANQDFHHGLLATLRTDIKLFDDVEQLRWSGPKPEFDALGARLDAAKGESRGRETRKSPRRPVSERRSSSPN